MGMSETELSDLCRRIAELSAPMSPVATVEKPRIGKIGPVRAVVFDVYGTLFVSGSGDIGTASDANRGSFLDEALKSAGLRPAPGAGDEGVVRLAERIHECHRVSKEEGVRHPEIDISGVWGDVLSGLAQDRLLESLPHPVVIRRVAVEYECRVNPVWPMPGAADLLAALRARGMIMGIVSNAQFFTPLLFRSFLGAEPDDLGFPTALSVWSYREREAKPSGRLYRKLADRLLEQYGVPAREALYIGNDMRNDIRPARDCGFMTVLFAGDQRSLRLRRDDPSCGDVRPDCVITELSQVSGIVKQGGRV